MNGVEAIRSEIERRIEKYNEYLDKVASERTAWKWAECKSLLSFIDSLPEEPSDLEEEINSYYQDNLGFIIGPNDTKKIVEDIARHFAEWGAERVADDSKTLDSDLEEAAKESWAEYEYREHPKGLYHTCYIDGFKAGAEWQKEQLKNKDNER